MENQTEYADKLTRQKVFASRHSGLLVKFKYELTTAITNEIISNLVTGNQSIFLQEILYYSTYILLIDSKFYLL